MLKVNMCKANIRKFQLMVEYRKHTSYCQKSIITIIKKTKTNMDFESWFNKLGSKSTWFRQLEGVLHERVRLWKAWLWRVIVLDLHISIIDCSQSRSWSCQRQCHFLFCYICINWKREINVIINCRKITVIKNKTVCRQASKITPRCQVSQSVEIPEWPKCRKAGMPLYYQNDYDWCGKAWMPV